ncbi:M14 family zinc carboxypeptidase [Mariniphaga sediminis]|uniref:M14 family zinc carboxypeptidase n=1 Tax=Mariniphaga sediminis TaxID=1628158 RepID=UPI00356553F3
METKSDNQNAGWTKLHLPLCALLVFFSGTFLKANGQELKIVKSGHHSFEVPASYLEERENIPSFWLTTIEEVSDFLYHTVRKGRIKVIGTSAGGRPVRAIFYGKPRAEEGTTTFSGSLGFRDVKAYRGPDHDKTVYLGLAAVHGGEFEGIVGMVNLISVIETGQDLRGKEWPEINKIMEQIDRLILIPMVNPDGRARIPLRMEAYQETDHTVHEFLNTGGNPDGTIIGWPQIKEFIPLDFGKPGFPGGYPNDAGVNIQHDNFFGTLQPETQALFDLAERERPDLVINMHTGAVYMNLHRPFSEPVLKPAFNSLYKYVHSKLASEGLQYTKNTETETNPERAPQSVFNLDGALNLHCGALSVVVESPSHSFSGKTKNGKTAVHTPEMLLDAQLICHQEAMRFLAESGGRSKWTPAPKR